MIYGSSTEGERPILGYTVCGNWSTKLCVKLGIFLQMFFLCYTPIQTQPYPLNNCFLQPMFSLFGVRPVSNPLTFKFLSKTFQSFSAKIPLLLVIQYPANKLKEIYNQKIVQQLEKHNSSWLLSIAIATFRGCFACTQIFFLIIEKREDFEFV